MKKILVTGGAGYIGSHTVIELVSEGYEPVIIDNLNNSQANVVDRLNEITKKQIKFAKIDLLDKQRLIELFKEHQFEAVIHFAGHKAVGESVKSPIDYYRNNIDSTLTLIEVMNSFSVYKLIFSSSATVYGDPYELPLKETSRTGIGITNPYGWTKYMLEQILRDLNRSNNSWDITILRYFNPIGAHDSGKIGEQPSGTPNNLFPYIQQVAAGKRELLSIYGGDYDTPDGTGIRDYIHVVDLSRGHVVALDKLSGLNIYNLGTGKGTSVLKAIKAFERASGQTIPYEMAPRRDGDIAVCYADPTKANTELGWRAEKTIDQACVDAWRWQQYLDSLKGK